MHRREWRPRHKSARAPDETGAVGSVPFPTSGYTAAVSNIATTWSGKHQEIGVWIASARSKETIDTKILHLDRSNRVCQTGQSMIPRSRDWYLTRPDIEL